MATQVNWSKFQRIEILGIDEIALKKGHRDYVVLVTTPRMGRVQGVEILAVLAERKKETVVKFFASIPLRLRKTIERVCTDMYTGFVNAAKEQLPRAQIVIAQLDWQALPDRYHVAQAYRDCADKVRRQELKLLKEKLSKKEYEQIKGAMWPFRKSLEQLTDEEWALMNLYKHRQSYY